MTLLLRTLLACTFALVLAASPAAAKTLVGVVTHVTDGDSVWVRPAGGAAVQVRLQGIDAPESCQAFGPQARDALAARVLQRPVRVAARARDMYRRTVGRVSVDGQDVGAWLVAGGFAWAGRYRGRAGAYAKEEATARQARAGLWAGPAIEPRAFRKSHGSCRPA